MKILCLNRNPFFLFLICIFLLGAAGISACTGPAPTPSSETVTFPDANLEAAIRLKEGEVATEQEIRQFCQERMADYKLPRKIIFTDSLPNSVAASRESLRDYLSTLSS